jgi:hypothetical protein
LFAARYHLVRRLLVDRRPDEARKILAAAPTGADTDPLFAQLAAAVTAGTPPPPVEFRLLQLPT